MPDESRYRRQTLLARLTALFYAHVHGKTPVFADDFRRADRAEYETPVGDHRATVESQPPQIDPIGESDVPALDFSETEDEDRVLIPNSALPPMGAADDWTFGQLVERFTTPSSGSWTMGRRDSNNEGVSLGMPSNRDEMRASWDGSSAAAKIDDNNQIEDAGPLTHFMVNDGAQTEGRLHRNGALNGTTDISGLGSNVDNGLDLEIGAGINSGIGPNVWDGPYQLAFLQADWTSEPQAAFLDSLLRTGSVAPGTAERLASFFTGEPGAGLNRRLPKYLTDAFGAGGPNFWWSADRHIHGVDGEGVVQLPNFSGDWSSDGAVQRTDSAQSVARGSTERGKPLDRIETSAKGYPHVDETQQFSLGSTVVFSLFERESGETQNGILSWRGPGDVTLELRESSGTVDFNVRDSNGNQIVESVSLTTDSGFVAAAGRFDESTGEVEIFAESKSQSQLKSSSSQTFGGNFDGAELRYFALSQGVSGWAFQGDIKQIGYDLSGATSSEVSALVSSLVTNL